MQTRLIDNFVGSCQTRRLFLQARFSMKSCVTSSPGRRVRRTASKTIHVHYSCWNGNLELLQDYSALIMGFTKKRRQKSGCCGSAQRRPEGQMSAKPRSVKERQLNSFSGAPAFSMYLSRPCFQICSASLRRPGPTSMSLPSMNKMCL